MCSFFPGATFLKGFLEHIKFSRKLGCNKKTYESSSRRHIFLKEHIKFSKKTKNGVRTHINFPGEKPTTTLQNFQESFLKTPQVHKNTYDFPGEKR